MKRRYFVLQWRRFWQNRKNIGLLVLTVILSLYFGLVSVPNHHVIERVDPYAIQSELDDDQSFLKTAQKEVARAAHSRYAFHPSLGAQDAVSTYPTVIKYDRARLRALKRQDYRAYAKFSSRWYRYMDHLIYTAGDKNYTYPSEYYSTSTYPGYDGHYGYLKVIHLYGGLLKTGEPLTIDTLEERTTLQVLQRSLTGWTTLILLVIVCLFSCDLVTDDRRYRTILKEIPLHKTTIMWLKTAVAGLGILIDFFVAFLVVTACTAFRYGFGSFKLVAPIYRGRLYFKIPFSVMTLGRYSLLWLTFAILIVWLLIRLTMLISLLVRNEYVAALLTSLFTVSGKVAYFSLGMGFVYPQLAKFPMTYFTIGDSLSGYLSYLMDTPGWNFDWGIGPLLVAVLIVEALMVVVLKNRRFSLIK